MFLLKVDDVQLLFYSPYPNAIIIEKRADRNADWEPWQYYAHECTRRFSLPNDGQLTSQTEVNCRLHVR